MDTTPNTPIINDRLRKSSTVMEVAVGLGTEIIQAVMGNDMATGTHGERAGRVVISAMISKRIAGNLEKTNV